METREIIAPRTCELPNHGKELILTLELGNFG